MMRFVPISPVDQHDRRCRLLVIAAGDSGEVGGDGAGDGGGAAERCDGR
jgi:hypothetical protein